MNILFFLKPKAEVAFVYDYHTLRQAMEIMEYHKYSSIPMINREGKYVGTITEGDLLWGLKKLNILNLKEAEMDLEKYKIDQDNATKITVAQLNAYRGAENMVFFGKKKTARSCLTYYYFLVKI